MRKVILLGLIINFILAFTAGGLPASAHNLAVQAQTGLDNPKLAPQLRAKLSTLSADQFTTVIVTFTDQEKPNPIPSEGRAARLRRMILALQAKANSSQRGIRALLAIRRLQSKVRQVTPFWVYNGLSVTATADVIAELAARNEVQSITPDEVQIVPLAPQAYNPPQANLVLARVPALWDLGFYGQGVVVANMDSGVDVSHPDLAGSWRGGSNSWFDPYGQHPATPTDLSGHGTWTMGTMVGGDSGGTSLGVAPQAEWIAVKIFNDSGTATATAIHLGFQWLLNPDGNPNTDDAPDVVNNSWAFGTPGCNLEFQLDLQALYSSGVLPVFAAGNYGPGGSTSVSPANYPEAFAVGAVTNSDLIYGASSRGPSTCGEIATTYPEIVAPGVNIYTTDRYGLYTNVSGTSLAAPHVAGTLALLLNAFPDLSADSQAAALINGAVDLGPAGPDNSFGFGRLDALAAYQWLQGNQIPTDTTGPETTGLTLTPNPGNGSVDVALHAIGNDSATGGSNILAADYTLDGGAPVSMIVNTPTPNTSLDQTIPAATVNGLLEGTHVVAVRSQDALGNWGAFTTIDLIVDKTGPTTINVAAMPNPNNGTQGVNASTPAVRVVASINDSASNINSAEGFIDIPGANGTGFVFTASDGSFDNPTETGYGDIPLATVAQLSDGDHTIYVHAKDAAGNWGANSTTVLAIDKLPPTVSGLNLTPPASNNTVVAISVTANDNTAGNSNINGGEYFIDTAGAAGTGAVMIPTAAAPNTTITATIPTNTVAALTAGNHTVIVRARDTAGNWSTTISATLLIDRTPPTFASITLIPNSIPTGTASASLTVNGTSDGTGGSGVAGGEFWFGTTNITAGTGTAFSGTSGISIPTSSVIAGTYTVRVRIRDVAGNWSISPSSGVRTATLTVTSPVPDAIFSDGFELPTTLPGNWTSRSTTTASRLNNTTTAALIGSRGLQAQGNNTNYMQYNFGSGANPATGSFDARFYFNPNGNTGTNQDIFTARTTGGNTVFRISYRWNSGSPQVQVQVGTSTANSIWTAITTGTANRIEVVWQAAGSAGPNPGTLTLYVNDGTVSQSLTTTSTNSVGSFRMGSVTNGGNSTLEYFDAISVKRSVSSLIGP